MLAERNLPRRELRRKGRCLSLETCSVANLVFSEEAGFLLP